MRVTRPSGWNRRLRPRNRALLVAVLGIVLAAPASAQTMPDGFREEFLAQFGTSMSKFIALAQAMPEDSYTWSPGEGVMPVARVYAHVARYNYFYPSAFMGVDAPSSIDLETLESIRDKREIITLLENSRDHVQRLVGEIPPSRLGEPVRMYGRDVQQWAVLFQLLAHMNEHLGQSIAYARMNGVVPPWSQ